MSQNDLIIILTGALTVLSGVLGWFINRLITGIEQSVEELKQEIYRDRMSINKHIERLEQELKIHNINLEANSASFKTSLQFIQKKMDDLDKIGLSVSDLVAKIAAQEAKLDNFGRVIVLDEKRK